MYIKGQYALDYLVIIGMSMSALLIAVYLLYINSNDFSIGSNQNQLSYTSSVLLNEINYISSQSLGAQSSSLISFPILYLNRSFFCFNHITLSSSSGSFTYALNQNVSGFLPANSGLYDVIIRKELISNQSSIQVGLYAPISFVNFSATISGKTLNYKFGFYNASYALIRNVTNYNLFIYNLSMSLLYSTFQSTDGIVSSSVNLPSNPPYLVLIEPINNQQVFSTCV